jgi:2-polyprenyl-3-methyl-5-hydroxy-6-metoxy-1,4-benzoquinol methylase
MNFLLRQREDGLQEFMDDPHCDPVLLENTYRQFGAINRMLAGWGRVYRTLIAPRIKPGRRYTLLDLGCGGGDLAWHIARLARRNGHNFAIFATDPDVRAYQFAVDAAAERVNKGTTGSMGKTGKTGKTDKTDNSGSPGSSDNPGGTGSTGITGGDGSTGITGSSDSAGITGITFMNKTLEDLAGEGKTYDFIISNHLMHHLGQAELHNIMEVASGMCREMVIFNDIRRSAAGYLLFGTFIRPLFRNSFIIPDGLISIRRSYSRRELAALVPDGWEARTLTPFRLLAVFAGDVGANAQHRSGPEAHPS